MRKIKTSFLPFLACFFFLSIAFWHCSAPKTTHQGIVGSTVRPDQFQEIGLDLTDQNFETYSQKNGVSRKIDALRLKKYAAAKILSTPINFIPNTTGNTAYLNYFVKSSVDNSWYFVDVWGKAEKIGATTDPMTLISGDTENGLVIGSDGKLFSKKGISGIISTPTIVLYLNQEDSLSAHIEQQGILKEHLSDECVTTEKIADSTITSVDLTDNCIFTNHIYDNAITSSKIYDGTIMPVDLAPADQDGKVGMFIGGQWENRFVNASQGPAGSGFYYEPGYQGYILGGNAAIPIAWDGYNSLTGEEEGALYAGRMRGIEFTSSTYPYDSYIFQAGLGTTPIRLSKVNGSYTNAILHNPKALSYMRAGQYLNSQNFKHSGLGFGYLNGSLYTQLEYFRLGLGQSTADLFFRIDSSGYKAKDIPMGTAANILYYDPATEEIKAGVAPSTAGDNWGSQGVVSNSTLTGSGTLATPLGVNVSSNGLAADPTFINSSKERISIKDLNDVNQTTPSTGQVLSWNGTQYSPISISAGDNWGNQVVSSTGNTLFGDGTAANPLTVNTTASGLAANAIFINSMKEKLAIEDLTNVAATPVAVTGNVLRYNGTTWGPSIETSLTPPPNYFTTCNGGTYSSGQNTIPYFINSVNGVVTPAATPGSWTFNQTGVYTVYGYAAVNLTGVNGTIDFAITGGGLRTSNMLGSASQQFLSGVFLINCTSTSTVYTATSSASGVTAGATFAYGTLDFVKNR
jgi:hypothetical protein